MSKPTQTTEVNLKREIAVEAIIAYPEIVDPNEESNKYQAIFVVDPDSDSFKELQKLITDHSLALCGKATLPPKYNNPLRDGDELARNGQGFAMKAEPFRGAVWFRAKTSYKPRCVKGPRREPMDAADIRGGDHVVVAVTCYSYNNQSAGVAISLGAIWWLRPGDVAIEKGGSGGGAFGSVDTSKFKFQAPSSLLGDEDNPA